MGGVQLSSTNAVFEIQQRVRLADSWLRYARTYPNTCAGVKLSMVIAINAPFCNVQFF